MGLALLLLAARLAAGAGSGSVCIAAVPEQDDRHARIMPLARQAGGVPLDPSEADSFTAESSMTIRIDSLEAVPISKRNAVKISGLTLARRHLVAIRSAGRPVASFRFRFSDYRKTDLCLWYKPGYGQWVLDDEPARIKGCTCVK